MQRTISLLKKSLPFQKQLRSLKRAVIPYTSNPANDNLLLTQAICMAQAVQNIRGGLGGASMVEIGTGWVPILPLIFRAAGVTELVSVDHDKLMDRKTFTHAVAYIQENLDRSLALSGAPRDLFDLSRLPSRTEPSLEGFCRSANLRYFAPFDFLRLDKQSTDIVVSRAVLEHIPEAVLKDIFRHAASVVKPGGLMCHFIDMSDHVEHRDKSLSRVDMLRYSDTEWAARTNHWSLHLSRLRRLDYVNLLQETGWKILHMTGTPDAKCMQALKDMHITKRYATVALEELAILESMIIAAPAA